MGILSDAALEAFNDVQAELPEVIKAVNLVRRVEAGDYVPEIGQAASVTEATYPCRYFETTDRAIRDMIAPYVIGPQEIVAMVEGLTIRPQVGDLIGGRAVRAVGDYYGSGALYVVALA